MSTVTMRFDGSFGIDMQRPRADTLFQGRTYRLLSGCFGLFLAGIGVYALVFAEPLTLLRLAAGAALVVLGGNMVAAAWKGRESWLSRIGPLP